MPTEPDVVASVGDYKGPVQHSCVTAGRTDGRTDGMDRWPFAAACSTAALLMSLDSIAQHAPAAVFRGCTQAAAAGSWRRCSIGERRCYCVTGGAVSAAVTVSRLSATMLTPPRSSSSRQPALSLPSCRRPCLVDILRQSTYCCCCCDVSASLLSLFAIALCLSFVTSLAVVTDATTPHTTSGNRQTGKGDILS